MKNFINVKKFEVETSRRRNVILSENQKLLLQGKIVKYQNNCNVLLGLSIACDIAKGLKHE